MEVSEHRIRSIIDPGIEKDAHDSFDLNDLTHLMKGLFESKLFSIFKHVLILYMPRSLEQYFNSNNDLKAIYSSISSNIDSNIAFVSDKKMRCTMKTMDEGCLATVKQLAFFLKQNMIPLILGARNRAYYYESCGQCDGELPCNNSLSLEVCECDQEKISEALIRAADINISYYPISNQTISPESLRALAFLMALFYGVPSEKLSRTKEIEVAEGCCRDLRGERKLALVSYSMFRAHSFPSRTNPSVQPSTFSIDWHAHKPSSTRVNGQQFSLYRCDVLEPELSGINNSGVKRLFLTKSSGKTLFLAYTSNHTDPPIGTIRNRLNEFIHNN
jgi:hypothetical protein